MQIDVGRYSNHARDCVARNFYDMNFNFIPVNNIIPYDDKVSIRVPKNFKKIKKIAGDLSKPFPFARIDLYSVKGKIFFGEITFYPRGGLTSYAPPEYDRLFGDMWK